jgi:hypothetical protein
MNTINASTKFSGFQLHIGHVPWVIPPLVPTSFDTKLPTATETATTVIDQIHTDVTDT